MENLEGKVAFVTGGASGIGLGMAKAFLNRGMKVAIADIRKDRLPKAESVLNSPGNVIAIELDVRDRSAIERAADQTEEAFEKVHVVCNNAEEKGTDLFFLISTNLSVPVNCPR